MYLLPHDSKITCAENTPRLKIKFSVAPVISKGFYETIKDLQPDAKYVITPSGERFDRSDGLRICPLDLFLLEELALLG